MLPGADGINAIITILTAVWEYLQKFVESVHVYTSSELKGHAAKVEEDQKTRATQFDNMHAAMIKHCISLIRNCESLKKDIESREEFRSHRIFRREKLRLRIVMPSSHQIGRPSIASSWTLAIA